MRSTTTHYPPMPNYAPKQKQNTPQKKRSFWHSKIAFSLVIVFALALGAAGGIVGTLLVVDPTESDEYKALHREKVKLRNTNEEQESALEAYAAAESAEQQAAEQTIEKAVSEDFMCAASGDHLEFRDGGMAVNIFFPDDLSEEETADYAFALGCLKSATGLPESTIDKMNMTARLDGIVTDTWGGYEASWSYQPDDGLDLTIRKN